MICIRVDFPDPEGPVIDSNSPLSTENDISFNTVNGVCPSGNIFVIF
jgi:hypothetical protein